MHAKVLSHAYIFTRRQYFVYPPRFSWDANISGIRQNFLETPIFWASARIFMRRQDFRHTPEFSWDANISGIRQNFHETPIFWASANNFAWRQYFMYLLIFWAGTNISWFCLILLLQIFVYIFSIYLCIWVCAKIFGAIVLTLGLRLIL